MPTYSYQNEETGEVIDLIHPMSEIDNPSPELLYLITYQDKEGNTKLMKRLISAPNLHGFTLGTSTSKSSHS